METNYNVCCVQGVGAQRRDQHGTWQCELHDGPGRRDGKQALRRHQEAVPGGRAESFRLRVGRLRFGVPDQRRRVFAARSRDDHGAGGLAKRRNHAVREKRLLQLGRVCDGTVGRSCSVDVHRWTIRRRSAGQVL